MTKGSGSGGGMSRAAKKRARKKEKNKNQKLEAKNVAELRNVESQAESNILPPPPKKKAREHEASSSSSSADNTAIAVKEKKNNGKRKERKEEEIDVVVNEAVMEEDDPDDVMVEGLISRLKPTKILQFDELTEEEASATLEEGEEIDLREVLKEMTSRIRARCLLRSILGPFVTLEEFYEKHWEKEPLLVQKRENRFDGIMTMNGIKAMLDQQQFCYGRDLNVTRYEDTVDGVKRRLTLDQKSEGEDEFVQADPKDLWSNFSNGCTIRFLCPHKHNDVVHALLSTLETEWGCMVGANAYLTPPSESQGFAPHYDDIEAFVLQLEGRKRWKVYEPISKAEVLPRASSRDYNTEEDLKGVSPVIDTVLGPGDLLYMPRGWIHEACTLPTSSEHSLHLTVSAMQQWAWIDYLELLMPEALEAAAGSETSTSLREGLPLGFLDYMGAIHDEPEDPDALKQYAAKQEAPPDDEALEEKAKKERKRSLREAFAEEAKKRIMRVTKEALSLVDAACDQIGTRFLSDRLPPALTEKELSYTSEKRAETGGKVWPYTLCRLARPGIARLALEDGKAVLYHCCDNSRVFHENPLSPMEFEMDDAPALEMLLTTEAPHWIMVKDLIHDDMEDKMEIAQALYDEGILAIFTPDKQTDTT